MPSGSMPSHFAIFDYWKDKCITKDGDVYFEEEILLNKVDAECVITDWGEPQCWACGKIIPVENEKNYEEWIKANDFNKIYSCKTLTKNVERAHIVPKAISQNDDPSNLFLLCPRCHKESPDVRNRKCF